MGRQKNKGITLIALIITIIVLLILAGVVINLVINDKGIFQKAEESRQIHEKAQIKEEIALGIMSVQAETSKKFPPQHLTPKILEQQLPQLFESELTIEEDLSGTYREYNYWIDENYIVHIGNKINDNMQVQIQEEAIGTSSIKVSVKAFSKEGNIEKYIYYINNQEKEQTINNTYVIENLEPETEYKIKAVAIDAKGNKKDSNKIKIKTEKRTYLYNRGDQCVALTGGWRYTGYHVKAWGNATFLNDHISFKIGPAYSRVYCGTINKIDMSPYKKICINTSETTVPSQQVLSSISYFNNQDITGSTLIQGTVADISNYNDTVYYHITGANANATIQIYQVWLEK